MAHDPLGLDFGRDKKFCVYIYRDPRPRKKQEPIYVGKGVTKQRPDTHWRKGSHNKFLNRVLSKIRELGLEPIVEFVRFFDDEEDAIALEMALIQRIGRRGLGTGTLCNLTIGGDGFDSGTARKANASRTPEQRRAGGIAVMAALTHEERKERARSASLSRPVEERREHGRKTAIRVNAAMTPEQRTARSRKAGAAPKPKCNLWTTEQRLAAISRARTQTPQELSANGLKGAAAANAAMTPEQRRENGRKRGIASAAALTPEQRSERARNANIAAMAVLTPAQLSANGHKGGSTRMAMMTHEERSEWARRRWANRTPERRSEILRKANASRTPEKRTAVALKASIAGKSSENL